MSCVVVYGRAALDRNRLRSDNARSVASPVIVLWVTAPFYLASLIASVPKPDTAALNPARRALNGLGVQQWGVNHRLSTLARERTQRSFRY